MQEHQRAVDESLERALSKKRWRNPFGDGEAARKILKILSEKCFGGSEALSKRACH
jgi:UDP-N-acetylglucosamine 2-epimerase